ncbi:hypothetical protein O6H91_02G007000 [Diphasiastrum complanatum]|uniref:Uncharacterized protein n=1 Tax=Diphasiastrum complanatum TaxID=34168 RepID=A0ACC2ECI7_DIPCM|nr:hypothetical protein O6H91_02G007000 [Diphasiastrum complanatum]
MASRASPSPLYLLSDGAVGGERRVLTKRAISGVQIRRQIHAGSLRGGECQAAASSSTSVKVDTLRLGQSEVEVTAIGIGAWSWGDTGYWNEGTWDDRKLKEVKAAFNASVDAGLTFFDTAEVYGSQLVGGAENSESLLGRFIKERQKQEETKVVVATKFAALPWRLGRGSVISALKASLGRLGLSTVDVYQLHWPGLWGNEGYLDGLGDAVEQGLVKTVGVSNYNEKRLRNAYTQLKKRGIVLASNQVNYSLIYRRPENGLKQVCDELGITLIAYSPIAQGILSGKYTPSNPPTGPRGRIYNKEFLTKVAPVLDKLKELGQQYGKTSTQVALNWLVAQKNVVPIPGAKSASQAQEFAGALGWSLSSEEVQELRDVACKVSPVIGFPVENL